MSQIAGDDLQDPLDPIRSAASRDLDEAVRLAVENTNLADTLLVVAGLCPDGSENNTDVPIYATGRCTVHLLDVVKSPRHLAPHHK
jgi:hypothetical protein